MTTSTANPVRAVDVCLVLMPYAPLERPSIALSILKAVLEREGIPATVVYGNIVFAEEIGAHAHDIIGKTQSHSLAGEWTFAGAAFPGFDPDPEAYFAHIGRGLRALLPLVRQHGGRGRMPHILRAIRGRSHGFVDRLAHRILASGPQIVGCSSTFQQHCASLALLRRIKELAPAVVTVLGGANCEASMGVATHRECPWVDYVVSGEAEDAFLRLCQWLLGRSPAVSPEDASRFRLLGGTAQLPAGVIGPDHRTIDYETFRQHPPRARLEDLNRSPTPDYDDYFQGLQQSPVGLFVKPGLLVETSRGCWWGEVSHCTFCGLNGTSMGYRAKSPDRVVAELTLLASRYETRTFEVVDNILDMSYFKSVLPALAQRLDRFDIFYETKANLTRSHLKLMAEAGIKWLQPGIESLDDGLLRAIAKGTTARQNLQLMKWALDCGIYILWLLLYDIPGESDDAYSKMADWLPLIAHLQPPSGVSFIQYNRFSPYHTRPADFHLHLSPDRSYSFVYPWAAESLEDFAYFFDDYTVHRAVIQEVDESLERTGLRRIYHVVSDWQVQWQGRMNASAPPAEPVTLIQRAAGGQILVTDTRHCRVQEEFVLENLTAEVYDACDRALSAEALLRELATRTKRSVGWEEVGPIVARLCDQKLLLDLNGWYFSLASHAPLPQLPHIANYPGGRLRTVAEAEAAELAIYAERQLAGSSALLR